ncbi:MAG: DUF4091 domain-containing protein [Eubacteriales bacterium]|jgi:hypothetical protein|nr:DUF4091 domain-containing protein [Eubacteriales bacterium]
MVKLHLKQLSSLEKVFLSDMPQAAEYSAASVLKGEEFAYQIALWCEGATRFAISVKVESPIADRITVRKVGNVPSELPAYKDEYDENYLTTKPGLFPDVLYTQDDIPFFATGNFQSLWIDVKTDKTLKAGVYPITIIIENQEHEVCESKTFNLEIINAVLPEQELIFTQWFHTDCIATYYNVEVFSEKYWELVRKFMQTAADNGINMLLTPIFTPPLDTKVGGERPTVQLVDIFKEGNTYSFSFDKLKRWVDMCKECGIKHFEMAHLFTQWGAKSTPKIMAVENGKLVRIFGWDVSATSEEYKVFLNQFLPALVSFLKQEGIEKQTYFHISDEPSGKHIEQYQAARAMVEDLLEGFVIFDALSEYKFYEMGVVTKPVPATNHIEPFLQNKVPNLWTYNCCAQKVGVGNRFMAMPSYRNRILGLQMYKYDIAGFLHWGYNFYYSQFSMRPINPFLVTDADGAYPSGDPFSVYPGSGGPLESLRLKVFKHALQDMQVLKCLEKYVPKEEIVAMMDEETNITFDNYPHSAEFILNLREKVNEKIKKYSKG